MNRHACPSDRHGSQDDGGFGSADQNLQPYQEAFFCARAGSVVHTVTSGEQTIQITGIERASGGVIIEQNGAPSCVFAVDACVRFQESGNPYFREIVSKIHRLQTEARFRLDAA